MSAEHRGVALVTGGAVRVGRGIALALAEAGFDIALSYRSSIDAAANVKREIEGLGRRAATFQVDLTEADAPATLIDAVREALGPLDVLVSSAASFVNQPLAEVSAAAFDRQMALNVRAPLLLAKAAAGELGRNGRGRIIHISDLSSERPFGGFLVHSATKAALSNLTAGLAQELAPSVQVSAVIPGPVAPPDDWSADEVAAVLARTPVGRVGAPSDVGEAVVYLATCSAFVTGAVIHVDGGRHTKS